jgi:Flp pilus assembly pilin Flp
MLRLRRLLGSERAQAKTEYLFLVFLIAIAAIGTVTFFVDDVRQLFGAAADALSGNDVSPLSGRKSALASNKSLSAPHEAPWSQSEAPASAALVMSDANPDPIVPGAQYAAGGARRGGGRAGIPEETPGEAVYRDQINRETQQVLRQIRELKPDFQEPQALRDPARGGGYTRRELETYKDVLAQARRDAMRPPGWPSNQPPEPVTTPSGLRIEPAPAGAIAVQTSNGYRYTVDPQGRVVSVEGELTLNPAQGRNLRAQREAGGVDRLDDDDGGHYIGGRFDGPTEPLNHFAQDRNFNRSAYKKLENSWEAALKEGKQVKVRIVPTFADNSQRPTGIRVDYSIDGRPQTEDFENKPGG